MLDMNTAKLIKNYLDKNGFELSFEDVCRMQPIPVTTETSGYTILGLQYADLTIMVWLQFNEQLGVMIRKVITQHW